MNKTGEKRGCTGCSWVRPRSAHRPLKRARRGEMTCACDLPGSISYALIQHSWRGDRIRTRGGRICGLGPSRSRATTLPLGAPNRVTQGLQVGVEGANAGFGCTNTTSGKRLSVSEPASEGHKRVHWYVGGGCVRRRYCRTFFLSLSGPWGGITATSDRYSGTTSSSDVVKARTHPIKSPGG